MNRIVQNLVHNLAGYQHCEHFAFQPILADTTPRNTSHTKLYRRKYRPEISDRYFCILYRLADRFCTNLYVGKFGAQTRINHPKRMIGNTWKLPWNFTPETENFSV